MNNISINNINNNKRINFKAKKIALTQNSIRDKITNIDIFELNHPSDNSFLNKLGKIIDFNKLFPKYSEEQNARVQKVFNFCIQEGLNPLKQTLIAVCNNKICGIATYFSDNNMYIDGLCSIPTNTNKKENLVGKTLFYLLFQKAKEKGDKSINLDAVFGSTTDLVKKYKSLGFKDLGYDSGYEVMKCNKYNIAEQIKLLGQEIDCEFPQDNLNYNLEEFL